MYRGEQHNLIIPSPTENLFQWNFCARRDELRAGGDTFSVHPHRLSSRFHNTKPCPKTSTRHDTKFVQHPAVLCCFPLPGPQLSSGRPHYNGKARNISLQRKTCCCQRLPRDAAGQEDAKLPSSCVSVVGRWVVVSQKHTPSPTVCVHVGNVWR